MGEPLIGRPDPCQSWSDQHAGIWLVPAWKRLQTALGRAQMMRAKPDPWAGEQPDPRIPQVRLTGYPKVRVLLRSDVDRLSSTRIHYEEF